MRVACSALSMRMASAPASAFIASAFAFLTVARKEQMCIRDRKKALGTTAEAGEFPCSFAFYKQRVFKATGSTKMYYSESKNDPLNPVSYTHLDVYKRQTICRL